MKKLRIAAVVLMLILAVAVFSGCDKVKVDDVKDDPMQSIADAYEITFGESSVASLGKDQDKVSVKMNAAGESVSFDGAVYLDKADKKGAVQFAAEESYEYEDFDGETITEEEKIDFEAYYADKQVVLKSSLLNDLLGTDTVGADFGITLEELKNSGIYELIVSSTGMTDEGAAIIEKLLGTDGITALFSAYLEDIQKAVEEPYEIGEVTEKTVEIGDEEIKAVAVTLSVKENIIDDIMDKTVDAVVDIAKLAGAEPSEDEIAEMEESILNAGFEMTSEATYYISAKTGALIKIETESSVEYTDEYDDKIKSENTYEITFGAEPEKELLPEIKCVIESDDQKVVIKGETTKEEKAYVFDGKITTSYDGEDEEEFKFTFELEGKEYKFTAKVDDEKYVITGELEISDKELRLTADLTEAYDYEIGESDITELEITVTFGEDVPKLPEYKDIFDYTADELTSIIGQVMGGIGEGSTIEDSYYDDVYGDDYYDDYYGDYDDYYYDDSTVTGDNSTYDGIFREYIMDSMGVDAAGLEDYIDTLATNMEGADSEMLTDEEIVSLLYLDCAYLELNSVYGVSEATLDNFLEEAEAEYDTYYDIAVALYDSYADLAIQE